MVTKSFSNIIDFTDRGGNTSSGLIVDGSEKKISNPFRVGDGIEGSIGNTSNKMTDHTSELIDAKIARAKAETSVEITRMEGKLDNILSMIGMRFDASDKEAGRTRTEIAESRRFIAGTVIVSAIAICGVVVSVIVAMALYGDTMFGRGMNAADLARSAAKEAIDALRTLPSSRGQ